MPRLSISDRMNSRSRMEQVSKEGFKEVILDYRSLVPSEDNFYPLDEIEELADNMLTCGHIEPIVVARVDGKDLIVSGHRRYFAIGKNIDRGHEEFKKVRCTIKAMSRAMYMFTLASANAFTRKLNEATLLKQAETLRSSLNELVESGEIEIQGKMRDYIADTLGISHTKMAQVDKVNTSLVEEGKDALAEGKITFSKAYETSRLPKEDQKAVIDDDSLLSTDVRKMVAEKKAKDETKEPKVTVEMAVDEAVEEETTQVFSVDMTPPEPELEQEEEVEVADESDVFQPFSVSKEKVVEYSRKRIHILDGYIRTMEKESDTHLNTLMQFQAEKMGHQLILQKYGES